MQPARLHACPSPAGFEQLCRLDPQFKPYGEVLLSRSALSVNRDHMTAADNAKLDATLHDFLGLLTNQFLTPPAFQVLEFMIRKYK
jgi:hypothetical protein